MRISVVLPQPFGPSQAKQRPRGTSTVTSSTASFCPNRFETCSSWMIASLTVVPLGSGDARHRRASGSGGTPRQSGRLASRSRISISRAVSVGASGASSSGLRMRAMIALTGLSTRKNTAAATSTK